MGCDMCSVKSGADCEVWSVKWGVSSVEIWRGKRENAECEVRSVNCGCEA